MFPLKTTNKHEINMITKFLGAVKLIKFFRLGVPSTSQPAFTAITLFAPAPEHAARLHNGAHAVQRCDRARGALSLRRRFPHACHPSSAPHHSPATSNERANLWVENASFRWNTAQFMDKGKSPGPGDESVQPERVFEPRDIRCYYNC